MGHWNCIDGDTEWQPSTENAEYTDLCTIDAWNDEMKEVGVAYGDVWELCVDIRDEEGEQPYVVFLT